MGYRVSLDHSSCAATADCMKYAPGIFELGPTGAMLLNQEQPPESRRAEVQQAADMCPNAAIIISEGP